MYKVKSQQIVCSTQMSEFEGKEDEASCQKKLAPPRSLRDAGGKAQIVWDMIAKRYPKAAPLLCEMETVIDRAETLLHQLRRAPYDNKIGKANSTQIAYSAEFEKQNSTSSLMESSSTSGETNEEVEEVGTRISSDRISEMKDLPDSTSSASIQEAKSNESVDSRNRIPIVDSTRTRESQVKKRSNCESQNRSNYDDKRDGVRTKEVESLEGWDRVAGGGETSNSKNDHTKKEVIIGRQDQPGSYVSSGQPTIRQSVKSKIPSLEESGKISERKTTGSSIDDTQPLTTKKTRKNEMIKSPKKRDKPTSDSSPHRNPASTLVSLSPPMETEKTRKKDTNKTDCTIRRTPLEILKSYAKQIKKEIKFKDPQKRGNSWKSECSFAGFTAEAIGDSKPGVENGVAMIILRMLAEKQMDEKDMENLTPFSDDQIRDIVALGTGGQPENAMRKLYKLCLEKNAPKPIYVVKKENGVEGVKHSAECRALNEIGYGSSIRDESAKISAAEELYTKLRIEKFP